MNDTPEGYELVTDGAPEGYEIVPREFDFTSSDDWFKALEGLGIATGVTGEVNQGIQDMVAPGAGENIAERGLNIVKSTADGIGNAIKGATSDTLDMVGAVVPGASGLWDTADSIRETIPENSIGQLVGGTVTGGLVGNAVGSTAKKINQVAHTRTGDNAIKSLTGTKDRLNRALKTDGADDVFVSTMSDKKLVPGGEVPNYNGDVSISNIKPGVNPQEAFELPTVGRVAGNANVPNSTSVPVVSMIEKLTGAKIPVVSGIAGLVDKYAPRLAGPMNQKAAMKVREDFINEAMDEGLSRADGLKMFEDYVIKDRLKSLPKAGTAIGAIVGANAGD